jgi:hypothetical protein
MKSGIINGDSIVLVSIYPGRYIADQMPSGRRYEFDPGTEVKVLKMDAEILLKRHRPVGCCGAPPVAKPLFEVMGG